FIGQEEAGIYEAAAKTAMLASLFLTAVSATAAPMIASLHGRGDHASLQGIVTSATRWMWFPSLVIALGLIFLASPILGLFGPVFAEGRWALRLLALGQLINASTGPVGYLMGLTGYQNLSARVFGITAMVNIVLNATFIPIWGLEGAALATMGTTILWNVWLYILIKKHLGIRSFVFSTVR
ncbi:MAG: polysaccharide biosynthesis C-terminal domain-containing protein, partial [Gammaproteobacteria bacterium]